MKTMTLHKIKLREEFCDAVLNGEKTFEIHFNDRGYQKGDHIRFIPIDAETFAITIIKHPIEDKEYEITYVLSDWGLQKNYVALAIKEVKQ